MPATTAINHQFQFVHVMISIIHILWQKRPFRNCICDKSLDWLECDCKVSSDNINYKLWRVQNCLFPIVTSSIQRIVIGSSPGWRYMRGFNYIFLWPEGLLCQTLHSDQRCSNIRERKRTAAHLFPSRRFMNYEKLNLLPSPASHQVYSMERIHQPHSRDWF